AAGRELATARLGAPVLPHDGSVHRTPSRPLPDDDGLALVRDADRHRRGAGLRDRVARRVSHALEDFHGVVLDPPRAREVLWNFPVPTSRHASVVTDHQARDARRALVDREDVLHPMPREKSNGGRCTPRSLTIAVISSAGVTSNAGL